MFVIVVEDDAASQEDQQTVDAEIKVLLVSSPRVQEKVQVWWRYKLILASRIMQAKIHRLYIADTMNPFNDIGSPIASSRFDQGVQKYVAAFNLL